MQIARMHDHVFVSSLVAVLKRCLQPCPGVSTSVASVNMKLCLANRWLEGHVVLAERS